MSGGGYRGGSTVFRAGKGGKSSPRQESDQIEDIIDARRAGKKPGDPRPKKKKVAFGDDAPGLHVLSIEDRRQIMHTVRKSHQVSENRMHAKEKATEEKRRTAFANFVKAMREREGG